VSNLVEIDYDTAHKVVDSNNSLYWNGWTIVEWKKNDDAFFKKNGSFRNGSWGLVVRTVPVSESGTWKVPSKYVMAK
jgi:hypothetical protein